jgi:hypothetical protein
MKITFRFLTLFALLMLLLWGVWHARAQSVTVVSLGATLH